MKWLRPWHLMLAGIVIFVGGFCYAVILSGIPYQDPTPEQYASWKFHGQVGNYIMGLGLLMVLCGLVYFTFNKIRKWVG